eukprot:NODE_4561_length_570_cov_163.794626_g3316_i0.p1 GENE.NODE_4561_length_570_cov_163.794626_g3316_i0~~NODE_4561_length_570_cov_163.794626_g3316_i0.p1  ORF type:complete len:116 (-),score=43.03 NODE_4561_length_570_cov_163.794626_g3316_i0:105-452(-)
MNHPPGDWNLDVEGQTKVSIELDTKLENACTFIIDKEDHTIGDILRMNLHDDDDVLFVGYKAPHPLKHVVHLKVHCTQETTPLNAVTQAIDRILVDLKDLDSQFQDQLIQRKDTF